MGDILKEAIADSKAVRETALENAKMALEEAFTPQLKSMLSAKLKEDDFEDEEDVAVDVGDEEVPEEEPEETYHYEDEEFGDEEPEVDVAVGDEEEPDMEEEGVIEINGIKYAPVVSEDEVEEDISAEDISNLDLESVIKELESEISEGEEEDDDKEEVDESTEEEIEEEIEIDETMFQEGDDDKDDEKELDEVDKSSDIGKGDNNRGSTDTSSGIGTGGQEKATKMESVQAELKEYKEAVSFLKNKLHEVNILNAKLLFTNKLFKEFALDNNQKLRVVETFDRAQTTREIKLVYSTLCEQFGDNGSINKRNSINESASAKSGSTKPSKESKKVITEEDDVANRFKKLAGLI